MSPLLPLEEAVAAARAAGNKVRYKARCHVSEHGIAPIGDKVKLDSPDDIAEGEFWAPVYWSGLTYLIWYSFNLDAAPISETVAHFDTPAINPKERILYLLDYHKRQEQGDAVSAHHHLSAAVDLIGDDAPPETWAALYHAFYGGESARDYATSQHRDVAILGEPSAAEILKRVRGEWKKLDYPYTHQKIAELSSKGVKPKALFEALTNDGKITSHGVDMDGNELHLLEGDKKPFRRESWRKKVKDLRDRLG